MGVRRYDLNIGLHSDCSMEEWPSGDYVEFSDFQKRDELVRELVEALERLRNNARNIFLKHTVRDWAETLAEADAVLAKAKAIDAEETRG